MDQRGIKLTENVDLDFLNNLEPKFQTDYTKFVVDLKSNTVFVGMDIHKDYIDNFEGVEEADSGVYGGNIYSDGSIVYTSTLNVKKNLKIKGFRGNPRIITDDDTINKINLVLFSWVKGL